MNTTTTTTQTTATMQAFKAEEARQARSALEDIRAGRAPDTVQIGREGSAPATLSGYLERKLVTLGT